jgi:lipoate-protein ligase A
MSSLVTQPPPPAAGRLLDLSYSSAFQNLALEEALAKGDLSSSNITVRLWENPATVILGRFQNPTDEVDVPFCESQGITLGRRFTGGGAVFHDPGNLNLTIISPRLMGKPLAELHRGYIAIILSALKAFGIEPSFAPPNAIQVLGKKIAGGAAWISSQTVLWHASILISTNTKTLNHALSPSRTSPETCFVRSKWQEVTTLQEITGKSTNMVAVKRELIKACERHLGSELSPTQLTEKVTGAMMRLLAEKYSRDDWNLHGHLKSANGS